MKTIEQELKTRLEDLGLWPNEAEAVVEKAKADPRMEAMSGRWEEDISGYPDGLLGTVFLLVKCIAVEYLKATSPSHFALKLLEGVPTG